MDFNCGLSSSTFSSAFDDSNMINLLFLIETIVCGFLSKLWLFGVLAGADFADFLLELAVPGFPLLQFCNDNFGSQ
jgi:hypothetical protein